MVKWRINTLSPQEIAKYRQRSVRAINGLNYCKQNAHIIAQYEKVTDKYKTIADYMGLGQEGGNSYYNFFVPTNKNIVFLLRNANHNNLNPSLYDMHEQLGRPNKRFVIFFKNGNTFSDVPVVFQESEHHVIPYNVNALDNEASIIAYIDALIKLFTEGNTTFPNLPIVTENKQHTNTNKKLIRLTESDLHRIVKESVNQVLLELDWKTYASAADKDMASDKYFAHGLRSRLSRADDFRKAAVQKFKDDYAPEDTKVWYDQYAPKTDFFMKHDWNDGRESHKDLTLDGKIPVQGLHRINLDKNQIDKKYGEGSYDAYKRTRDEYNDFKHGNYDYQKGKGWQLKK